uniref:Uncharacterized protein n=1 Tax=Timema poppense TaxID=170557 RepID=A0A7R9CX55_TIMPO|nr:unnamed protein product [Timema poppensis]
MLLLREDLVEPVIVGYTPRSSCEVVSSWLVHIIWALDGRGTLKFQYACKCCNKVELPVFLSGDSSGYGPGKATEDIDFNRSPFSFISFVSSISSRVRIQSSASRLSVKKVENNIRKQFSTPDLCSNVDHLVIDSLVFCESSALDHVTTEVVLVAVLHVSLVIARSVGDQPQSTSRLQSRGDYGWDPEAGYDHHFHHEPEPDHHQPDPHHHHEEPKGYWKKKLIWKPDWVKVWKPASKKIWKPAWKKYYKPEWKPIKIPVWKDIQVPDWKKIWKPVWKPIQIPAWKEIQVPAWKKIWKPVWVPISVPAWKEIKVPDWKKVWKPVWKPILVPAWKEIQVPDWKKIWVPELVKVFVPGEKHIGKDEHGWEYTSHGLWKKKVVWKPQWKKIWKPAKKQIWIPDKKLIWKEEWKMIWKPAKKQIWVPSKKLIWKEAWKQIWKPAKKQIWIPSKKLVWKEAWKQIWRPDKKMIWVPDKKLVWKEAWKKIWVPDWKKIWVPAWKKVWKPVWIHEWVIVQDHHPPPHDWNRRNSQESESRIAPVQNVAGHQPQQGNPLQTRSQQLAQPEGGVRQQTSWQFPSS